MSALPENEKSSGNRDGVSAIPGALMARETVQRVVAPEPSGYALLCTEDTRRRWRRVAATV
jgi:hypothetical protein